jgi:translation initiation factor IF-2
MTTGKKNAEKDEKKNNKLEPRAPVVVVMGHIDHGKTTILDYIRKTTVAQKEKGGITQHIGAYEARVKTKEGSEKTITFLDTPGHDAFSKIRARGGTAADIAVLVIAADEGVKKQTDEALEVIKQTGVPFVVALNKIDKEGADPEKIKNELAKKGIYLEGKGGKIPSVNVSAKTGEGIDELLEIILLLAELEELKTNPSLPASGVVLESHIDPKRGISATLLIQNGTLKQGMFVKSENAVAPVRIMENFLGERINEAGASCPVTVIGFNQPPQAGNKFSARLHKEKIANSKTEESSKQSQRPQLPPEKERKASIAIILKADAYGSLEAVESELNKLKLKNEEVFLNVLKKEIGDIAESDVKLASAAENPIIVGFRVGCSNLAKISASRLKITIKLFDIIYELERWLEEEIKKRQSAAEKEKIIGRGKVVKIFKEEKNKKIIGLEIVSGKIINEGGVKIYRKNNLIGEGRILELRKRKDKIEEASSGEKVGVMVKTATDLAINDSLEIVEK